jgi:diguanylate cyclase (GGDEF)-like protein
VEKLQVLIIDDDREIAEFFSTVLTLEEMSCDIVLSAKDALKHLAASVPDLILLDMRLGQEIGGEDILYQIRSNPRYDHTRVVVITAYPAIAEMVTNVADMILIKPVEVEHLKTMVNHMKSYGIAPKRQPFRDPITLLFTREFFVTRLDLAIERSRRRKDFLFAVILFHVQPVNLQMDQMDPSIQIRILEGLADRLKDSVRPTDTVARFAGWKFAALLEELTKPEDIKVIINRVQEAMSEPFSMSSKTYEMEVSFGAAIHNRGYRSPEDVIQVAERAMEQARSSGQPGVYIGNSPI